MDGLAMQDFKQKFIVCLQLSLAMKRDKDVQTQLLRKMHSLLTLLAQKLDI